jgi:hypothetical protein
VCQIAKLDAVVHEMVERRDARIRSGALEDHERDDLLAQLLRRDGATGVPVLSRKQIADNIKTFLFAGHDTTCVSMGAVPNAPHAWAVPMQGRHTDDDAQPVCLCVCVCRAVSSPCAWRLMRICCFCMGWMGGAGAAGGCGGGGGGGGLGRVR